MRRMPQLPIGMDRVVDLLRCRCGLTLCRLLLLRELLLCRSLHHLRANRVFDSIGPKGEGESLRMRMC